MYGVALSVVSILVEDTNNGTLLSCDEGCNGAQWKVGHTNVNNTCDISRYEAGIEDPDIRTTEPTIGTTINVRADDRISLGRMRLAADACVD